MDDIVARKLAPGTMLPAETEMIKTYQIGRSTLREALRLLEMHDLLALKPGPGGGPMVMQLDESDFARIATLHLRMRKTTYRELLEARLAIEPLLARMAAIAQIPEGIAMLHKAIEMADAADPSDQDQWQYVSDLFHYTVSNMSGNSMLDMLGLFLREIYRVKPRSPVTPENMREHIKDVHREIANAIFAKDGEKAEQLMRDHMTYYARRSDELHAQTLDDVVSW